MSIDWDKDVYVTFLKDQRHKTFYLYPYYGNSGDTLIRMGTIELLSNLNIVTTVDPKKARVILCPGGNPSMWGAYIQELNELLSTHENADFIIGPAGFKYSGINWQEVLLRHANKIFGIFARDPQSFDNLQLASFPNRIYVGLSHDPALYLMDSEFIRQHRDAATSEYVLVSIRDDHEANWPKLFWYMKALGRLLPSLLREYWDIACGRLQSRYKARNIAKRLKFDIRVKIRDAAKDSFEVFVETIRRAKEVHTDRLHVMLLSVMLKKPVYAYTTSHGKLEAVYKHSLRLFDDVQVTFIRN